MTAAHRCPNCNTEIAEDARFCSNCGHQLGTEAAQEQTAPAAPQAVAPAASPSVSDEKTWAPLIHLAGFAAFTGIPFGNIVGPLVLWLIKRQESEMIDFHGKEALNFQISMTLYLIAGAIITAISGFLIIFLVGVILLPIAILGLICLGIFWIVMMIMAAVRASNGQDPGYLLRSASSTRARNASAFFKAFAPLALDT